MIGFELLSEDNINEVWEIEKKCFNDPWSKNMFTAELGNSASVFIVARDEETGKAIGYGGVWTVMDVADITNIAVDEEYRRQGVGGEILRLLIKICKERQVETVNLEVRTDNQKAINLYKKTGFEECGLRKKYYHNRDDALLMALKI